jgi:hypothetical protein
MYTIRRVIAFMIGVGLVTTSTTTAAPLPVSEPPSSDLSSVFITGFQTTQVTTAIEPTTKLDSIELYNSASTPVSVDGWAIEAYAANSTAPLCSVMIAASDASAYLRPNSYATIAQSGVLTPSAQVRFFENDCAQAGQVITRIMLRSANQIEDSIAAIPASGPYVRRGVTSTYRDQDPFSNNFISLSATSGTGARSPQTLYTGGWYAAPADSPLRIVEIYPDAASCAPNDTMSICTDYVKLYNPTSEAINLSNYRMRSGSQGTSTTTSNTTVLSGTLGEGQYVSVAMTLSSSGTWTWLEDSLGVRIYDSSVTQYPSSTGHSQQAWSLNPDTGAWQWTKYPTPGNEPNRFVGGNGSVNSCSGLRLSEIAANTDKQFIEVYNATSNALDISGCQLQTNRSQTASYIFAAGSVLGSGEVRSIYLPQTLLTLTKTTSGIVYVLDSTGTTEVDAQQYSSLKQDTSWALIDGEWRQTYEVTPGQTNRYAEYPACQTGYYRNSETGNCSKIVASSELATCAANQYRSEETNRCRLLVTAASSLQSCAANQYRNPETNRCRLLSSAESDLQPCAAGQERNLETNRCRKVLGSSVSEASDKLEDTPSGGSTIGWVAFAVVGTLAIGYAAWEWRHELASMSRSFVGKFKK